ncbi:MAG: nucleotide pyrophosphohydrolase [Cyanobacteria bacterium REEB65]|nr:nucleotide pyrophosphohydrolase [Cyanobacteria bacterium REEB65]
MTLQQAQAAVDAWIQQQDVGYWQPLALLARLTEEVGELAREVNHRFGEKPKRPDEAPGDLAAELADTMFILVCMANSWGIDLQTAFGQVLDKVAVRDAARWKTLPAQES